MTPNDFGESNETTLDESTAVYLNPRLQGWNNINPDDEESDVRAQIRCLVRDVSSPWRSVELELISPSVQILVMDVLQQELDDVPCANVYRAAYIKCLRALSKARNIMPSSFVCRDVTREGVNPIGGGGFADVWKGKLHDAQVCLKVLRVFIPGLAREKLLRDFCHEALVWKQLKHPNVLPFLGVNEDLFAPSYCLISPWMVNGNIMSYLETHPDHDRLESLIQIAEGMKYLHNHNPPIVHADIRGANVLVMDDLRCCLSDFGLSLFAESQVLDSSSRMRKGSIRWLAPEYMDSTLFDQSYLTARDVYAYGCTVIEIFTGKPPFNNIKFEAGVMYEVLTKQNCPPRPPLDVFPNDLLWSFVTRCLATTSSRRPSATQVSGFLACGMSQVFESLAEPEPPWGSKFAVQSTEPFIFGRRSSSGHNPTVPIDSVEGWLSTGGTVGDHSMTLEAYDKFSKHDERAAYTPTTLFYEWTTELPSDPKGEAAIPRQNLSGPSSNKRCRSSSPEAPFEIRIRSPTPTSPKTENIDLKPSQTSEGTDAPRAKRPKVGQPADVHALT
ncbi:kinase-like domain-containing protein [Armillaria luteobubalina]|uniref:Kinase-like domain-containing protein n=1 Tax=Armillaria luteobubalina TaxID=153913 RepID=A0AA39PJB3_9AGAR|nr:kinase-like domain-containing protein [Armillaria luteobubalina]